MAETKIKVTADTSQAERQIQNLEKALQGLDSVSAGAAKALAGITAAAAAMGYAILSTLESAGQLIDVSKILGISAANLQALQHAASQAGVGADQLNTSLIKLSGNLGSAIAQGSGPAIDALKKLGIPLSEISRMKPDEQFARIAGSLNAMTNPAERNAMAIDLFGKQGPRMLEVAKGLEAAKKELQDMGLALSDLDVAALDEAGDSVDSLKSIFESGLKKAVAEIAPYIVAIVNKIKDAIKEAGGFEAIWDRIKSAIREALNIALLTVAIGALAKMVTTAIALATAIRTAGSAMALFNAIVMRNPLMLAVGAAIALSKVLGIDVVGAITDTLMPTLDLQKANEQIAEKAQEIKETNEANVEAISGYNKEQQKVIDALNDTILKLEIAAQQQQDINTYGEVEARIRRTIAEESAKLEKVGLVLNTQQKERLANAIREEEAAKRIKDARQALSDAELKFAVPATKEFVAAAEEIKKANKSFIDAQATGNKELIAVEEQRLAQTYKNYQQTVTQYGLSLFERGRLDLEYAKNVGNIEAAMLANKSLNMGKETELYRALADEKLRLEQEYQSKRDQIEADGIQRRLMAQRGAFAQQLSENEQQLLQKIGAEERQRAIVQERINFEKKSELEKTQFVLEQGSQIFNALGAQNKKAFEAAKAFNIANAIMNTYMAATKALATYPWPFGMVAAAGAVAAGLAQVAQIRSQQYSGRALGGPVMGGQSYIVGESGPELFTPATTGSITRNGDLGGGGNVNVNFTIVANDTTGFDQLLASRKGVIQQIISDAMLEKGKRSMV